MRSMCRTSTPTESASELGAGPRTPSRIWWLAKIRPITPSRSAILLTVSSVDGCTPGGRSGSRRATRAPAPGAPGPARSSSSSVSSSAASLACERSISTRWSSSARTAASPSVVRPSSRRCGNRQPVDPVGDERDRRRVRGHLAEEEVGERHVGHAPGGELRDRPLDLARRGPEVEAALHAVHEHDLPRRQEPRRAPRGRGPPPPCRSGSPRCRSPPAPAARIRLAG